MSRIQYYMLKGDPYKDEEYPEETTVQPTTNDYSKGYFYRYFIQPKSDLTIILEIDEKQYNSYVSSTGINTELYNATKMKWKLRGQTYDVYKGETRITAGVWNSNKRTTRLKEKTVPGLSQKIVDYIKFATITRDIENPSGLTSFDEMHHHQYQVDSDGNGWALESVNPKNPNIKHRHKIVNWEIQEAQSNCYPNCKMLYGHQGAAPHIHTIDRK